MKAADWTVRMPVEEAAARMQMDVEPLKAAMRRSKNPFTAFGFCAKEDGAERGSYIIIRERFEAWMAARDITPGKVPEPCTGDSSPEKVTELLLDQILATLRTEISAQVKEEYRRNRIPFAKP